MMKRLFTERHSGGKERVAETLDDATREGLLTLVSARIDEEWFGLSFNEKCGDGYGNEEVVDLNSTSWNRVNNWLHQQAMSITRPESCD